MSEYLEHYRNAVKYHLMEIMKTREVHTRDGETVIRTVVMDEDGNVQQPEWRGGSYNLMDQLLNSLAAVDTHHIVEFKEDSYTLAHPIGERLRGTLYTCEAQHYMESLPERPVVPGKYRMYDAGEFWELFPYVESE